MNVELKPIDSIRPYPGNPRQNDAAVDAVAASLKEFRFRQPIVVDQAGVIIVGHTRYRAALKLGITMVPVHVADLTEAQARAYRIADNQTATIAQWDYDLLPRELGALQEMNFDLSLLGFDPDELAEIMAETTAGVTDPDELPEPPAVPVSQPGDLYMLGRHRLQVGDATKPDDVNRLMNGVQADLLLTDPPYGVNYVGKTKDALTIQNDQMDDEAFRAFLISAFRNADAVMRPGAAFYIWHADSEGFTFRSACHEVDWDVRQCLIWAKSVMVMGRQDYQWKHEPCLYGWKPGAAHQWLSDRCQTTVLEFDKPSRNAEHPTMKPVALFAYQMTNSCRKGQVVLDLFAGSGTTLIAAEQTGRTAYVLELDPRYADVVIARWERFTGKKAERIEGAPTSKNTPSRQGQGACEGGCVMNCSILQHELSAIHLFEPGLGLLRLHLPQDRAAQGGGRRWCIGVPQLGCEHRVDHCLAVHRVLGALEHLRRGVQARQGLVGLGLLGATRLRLLHRVVQWNEVRIAGLARVLLRFGHDIVSFGRVGAGRALGSICPTNHRSPGQGLRGGTICCCFGHGGLAPAFSRGVLVSHPLKPRAIGRRSYPVASVFAQHHPQAPWSAMRVVKRIRFATEALSLPHDLVELRRRACRYRGHRLRIVHRGLLWNDDHVAMSCDEHQVDSAGIN